MVLGSPHKHGSTNALAGEFMRGARSCGAPEATRASRYMREAYELGRSLQTSNPAI